MNEYDQTFNPNILIGHYDLISWFSDFALYLNTEWVYDHILSVNEKLPPLKFRYFGQYKISFTNEASFMILVKSKLI